MFSVAEWFLLTWAMLATACMGYYQHQCMRANRMTVISQRMLVGLMEGTAQMKKVADGAVFTNLGEDHNDQIYIKARQGQGSDSP